MRAVLWSCALAVAAPLACAGNPEPILVPPPPPASASASAAPPASSSPDPLGARPAVAEPTPFVPPAPEVFEGPGGSKVWLLERHGLPLVSVVAVSPLGASADGKQAGRAYLTADMLDEGTDKLDAVAFSRALDDLGAQFSSSAEREKSSVSLGVLSSKLPDALALMGAAITRPRHADKDWKRVASLWQNALKSRGDDPSDVARLATSVALWGSEHPYGRPLEGTTESARAMALKDVTRWHPQVWRAPQVTFVVVGDVSRTRITAELDRAFSDWKKPASTVSTAVAVAFPSPLPPAPRAVLVDRPEASQVVMTVARRSVSASSVDLPRLDLMNIALGGSFTSRLNQNLREDHGWTYGARTRFSAFQRGGVFLARASIRTDALSEALRETLGELRKMAEQGPTDEEVTKTKALARADAVDTYGSLQAIAASLAGNAALGLPPDHDARTLASQSSATRAELLPLAKQGFSIEGATILLVGPRKAIEAALKANNLPLADELDTEGRPVKPAP